MFLFRQKSKTYWPKDQDTLVRELFKQEIAEGKCPSKEKCGKLVTRFPHCQGNYRKLVMKVNNINTTSKGARR